jgi:hypothetical protein
MSPVERTSKGNALLSMAEALVAGREAGRVDVLRAVDNPFDRERQPDEHRAWQRGFWVGRSLENETATVQVRSAYSR